VILLVVVKKKKCESDDKLIARFRKKALDEGIVQEVRDRKRHTKESEKRNEQKKRIKHYQMLERKRNK